MNNGIRVDLDKLLEGKKEKAVKDKDGKKYSIDDIRQFDAEETLMERIRNRGSMTMQEYLMWSDYRDRHNNTTGNSGNDEIKALREEIKAMQENFERRFKEDEEKKRQEAMQNQINDLKNLILTSSSKKDDVEPNKAILDKITQMEEQLKDEKEKSRERENKQFQDSIYNAIGDIQDRIDAIRTSDTKPTKGDIEQMIELNHKKDELLKALGVQTNNKSDDASLLDAADALMDRVPKMAKTASTVRELFSKDDDIPDDIPDEDMPTTIPQRNVPHKFQSVIPDDIKHFLDSGQEKDGQFFDYIGSPWTNGDGLPISRKTIEDMAITDPGSVRYLIKQTEIDAQRVKAKKTKKEEINDDVRVSHKSDDDEELDDLTEPDDEPDDGAVPAVKPEKEPVKEPEKPKTVPADLKAYVETGKDEESEDQTMWVGPDKEIYLDEDGKPATKEQILKEIEEDPEGFRAVRDATLKRATGGKDEEGRPN